MKQYLDSENHKETRAALRVVGVAVLGVGLIFMAIGLISFFSAFGSFGPPRYFWCVFVGMPLLGIGSMICKFAFMGAVARFAASEVAPVGKDVVNYMVDGTKESVRDVASAIGEGLASARSDSEMLVVRCHKCNANNDADANFCQGCGTALAKTIACPQCKELNDPDAKFCDNCGEPVR